MIKRGLFLTFLLVFTCKAFNQALLKKYVESNATLIRTIDPKSQGYDDLEIIGKSIGDARIVMLGEQDHGDAPTFLAKTRLIKYLHEQKGFNVLAFESDFFGLNYGWDGLKKGYTEIVKFIRNNIYPVWSYCNTCSDLLYNYIPATYINGTPLAIIGFDDQVYLEFSSENLITKLDSVSRSLKLPIVKREDYVSSVLPAIDSLITLQTRSYRSADFYSRNEQYLKEVRRQMEESLGKDSFWLLMINNLIRLNKQNEVLKKDPWQGESLRDFQMAQNLEWISEVKYPNEKIIVWAANEHIAKYTDSSGGKNKSKITRMGSFFTKKSQIMKQTYILGFTSFTGTAGRLGNQVFSIIKPRKDSFERWIESSYNYAFVDFQKFNKQHTGNSQKFFLQGLSHQNFKLDWTKIFDGIFYIKSMYPCSDSN